MLFEMTVIMYRGLADVITKGSCLYVFLVLRNVFKQIRVCVIVLSPMREMKSYLIALFTRLRQSKMRVIV